MKRRGDAFNGVDAFSRAILSEKDVAVRGYLENLRSQIATIVAAHGANARDVWNKEVQDRMSVDEMDKVNALFAKIKGISEKKLSRAQEREMLGELDRREAEAKKMFARANRWERSSNDEKAAFVKWFLRSGLTQDARHLLESSDYELSARVTLAQVANLGGEPAYRRVEMLKSAVSDARQWNSVRPDGDSLRLFLEAYNAMLPLMTGSELLREMADRILAPLDEFRPLAVARIKMEVERRGAAMNDEEVRRLLSRLDVLAARDVGDSSSNETAVMALALSAEAAHSVGKDPRPFLDAAVAELKAKRIQNQLVDEMELVELIANSSARVGAWDLIESLQAADWWKESDADEPGLGLHVAAAEGCIATGNFDKAIEFISAPGFVDDPDGYSALVNLVTALYDADQIERGDQLRARFTDDPRDTVYYATDSTRLVARARRGDDVLASADRMVSESLAATWCSLILGAAAIGTMGYTTGMRKRIAEYASKQ